VDWRAFLDERPLGVLATVGREGLPHAVPVEVVVHEGKVYAWCESDSAKVANVMRTGKAAMLGYKGVAAALVRGAARVLTSDDAAYSGITNAFLTKYKREETFGNDVLVEITPDRVTAWEE
jgi:nitroimidazol reductase NimA-like FMN-containing flavoprotein (pyridoxamine 5'-phosphate oxidase superfamily)